jgi:uncharacterized protein with GYD domain
MPTYISLLRYTQQGIAAIKQGPTRLDAAKQAYKKAGGELKAFYLTIGQFDAVAIAELPDDTALARMVLALGAMGNVRTETLRAFNVAEFRKIVGELPLRGWAITESLALGEALSMRDCSGVPFYLIR